MRSCIFRCSLAILCFGISGLTAESKDAKVELEFYQYSPQWSLGIAVPEPGWEIHKKEAPEGYPQYNHLFSWTRRIDAENFAIIAVTRLPILVDTGGKKTPAAPKMTLLDVENTFRGFFERDMGARVVSVTRRTIAGREWVEVLASGVGNGMAINPRLRNLQPTKCLLVSTFLDSETLLRIQCGAPVAFFDALRPDFEKAISTVHFGPQSSIGKPLVAVDDKALAVTPPGEAAGSAAGTPGASHASTAPGNALAPSGSSLAAPRASAMLSDEQWTLLEEYARKRGVPVGVLLRKIVDDFFFSSSAGPAQQDGENAAPSSSTQSGHKNSGKAPPQQPSPAGESNDKDSPGRDTSAK